MGGWVGGGTSAVKSSPAPSTERRRDRAAIADKTTAKQGGMYRVENYNPCASANLTSIGHDTPAQKNVRIYGNPLPQRQHSAARTQKNLKTNRYSRKQDKRGGRPEPTPNLRRSNSPGVADEVGVQLAVGQGPDLDQLIPSSGHDDGSRRRGGESYARHPLGVALLNRRPP